MVPETANGRGWANADAIDFAKLPTLPELIVGRAEGRKSDDEVTCFHQQSRARLSIRRGRLAALPQGQRRAALGHDLPTDWFTEDVHP